MDALGDGKSSAESVAADALADGDALTKLATVLHDDGLAGSHYLELAAKQSELPATAQLANASCGNLSQFNANYQMKLAMVLHLQNILKSLAKSEPIDPFERANAADTKETVLPANLLSGLCANFDLLTQFALDDPSVCKEVSTSPHHRHIVMCCDDMI